MHRIWFSLNERDECLAWTRVAHTVRCRADRSYSEPHADYPHVMRYHCETGPPLTIQPMIGLGFSAPTDQGVLVAVDAEIRPIIGYSAAFGLSIKGEKDDEHS